MKLTSEYKKNSDRIAELEKQLFYMQEEDQANKLRLNVMEVHLSNAQRDLQSLRVGHGVLIKGLDGSVTELKVRSDASKQVYEERFEQIGTKVDILESWKESFVYSVEELVVRINDLYYKLNMIEKVAFKDFSKLARENTNFSVKKLLKVFFFLPFSDIEK